MVNTLEYHNHSKFLRQPNNLTKISPFAQDNFGSDPQAPT